jgi:hypothetical protein
MSEREQRNAVDQLRAEVQRELSSLRGEMQRRSELHADAVGEAMGVYSDKTIDYVEKAIKQIESQLWVAIERRYGELMGRLDAVLTGTRPRSTQDFRFANERYDVVDLPNPLRKGMN